MGRREQLLRGFYKLLIIESNTKCVSEKRKNGTSVGVGEKTCGFSVKLLSLILVIHSIKQIQLYINEKGQCIRRSEGQHQLSGFKVAKQFSFSLTYILQLSKTRPCNLPVLSSVGKVLGLSSSPAVVIQESIFGSPTHLNPHPNF